MFCITLFTCFLCCCFILFLFLFCFAFSCFMHPALTKSVVSFMHLAEISLSVNIVLFVVVVVAVLFAFLLLFGCC